MRPGSDGYRAAAPLRRLDPGTSLRRLDLSVRTVRLPTAMEASNAERARLYQSKRWRRERREFLLLHPVCAMPGCSRAAQVVDHREGHRRADWRERFWDSSTWQPMCDACHGAKSRAELTAWRQAGEATITPGGGGVGKTREGS